MSEILLTLLFVNFLGMMSPGPDMMMIIRYGSTGAKRATFCCLFGIMTGLCIHLLLAIFGVSLLISQSPLLFSIVKYTGAAYLIYLGIKAWRSQTQDIHSVSHGPIKASSAYFEGLCCNLLNPKVLLVLVAMFSQLIAPDTSTSNKLIIAVSLALESVVIWALFVRLLYSGWLNQWLQKHQKRINKVAGGALVSLGSLVGIQLS